MPEAVQPWSYGADVVDENVDSSVAFDGFGDEALGTGGLDQVDLDGRDAVDAVQRVNGERPGDDECALCGERSHDSGPDAFASAGDDGHPLVELEVHQLARKSRRALLTSSGWSSR